MKLSLTLLGTGTSTGIPLIGCSCKTCTSVNPKDKRLRTSALFRTGEVNILIDTSADFRQQMLTHRITDLDAICFTHHHFDHISGFDDIRAFNFLQKRAVRCYALEETTAAMKRTFPYAFSPPLQQGGGVPQAEFTTINSKSFSIEGITVTPVPLNHGAMNVLGFRIGNIAYCTDCNFIPESSMKLLEGVEILVIDGLRYAPHETHFSVDEATRVIERIAPRRAYLTHINHDIMHDECNAKLPVGVECAYDGLVLNS